MKKLISIICCVLALTVCLTACGQRAATEEGVQSLAKGGVLILRVNPEIEIEYDENGTVTGVTARNDDALAIINSCTGLIGQPAREVVTDLVTAIGEAGYFVEEMEGERRRITLEIEPGSSLPNAAFLDEVIEDIREAVSRHDWSTPLVVEGESDFGISDYIDTGYGADNDGVTDYEGESAYDPTTDYDDTDYGNGQSDYGDGNSNYGDGRSDYNDGSSNYGDSAYGDSGYEAPAATNPPAASGDSDYDGGKSDYHDGNSDYDDGHSDYNDSNSDYGDGRSDYGDADSDYESGSDYDDASDYGDSDYE